MGWVQTSRILPEGELPGLSKILRPKEKLVLINHAWRAAVALELLRGLDVDITEEWLHWASWVLLLEGNPAPSRRIRTLPQI